jgi:hypothetical protein
VIGPARVANFRWFSSIIRILKFHWLNAEGKRWRNSDSRIYRRLALCVLLSAKWSLPAQTQAKAGVSETQHSLVQSKSPNLQTLYAARRWFELRDACASTNSPALYLGAVAAVFNRADDAEKLLRSVINEGRSSDQAYDAYEFLMHLYLQTGQYERLNLDMKRRLLDFPGRPALQQDLAALGPLLKLPNQVTVETGHDIVHHDRDLFIPCTINGAQARYFVDTGAGISSMSESEAKRLGIGIRHTSGKMGTSTTRQVQFRTAVAKELVVGGVRLKNVSFAIFPDDQEPWVHLPPRERGLLGIPVLLASQRILWSRKGTMGIGPTPGRFNTTAPNLCFDNDQLMVSVRYNQSDILMRLDTGAVDTEFYAPFATRFSELLGSGTRGFKEVRGVGQTENMESVTLPGLKLGIGGPDLDLRPAVVLLKQVGPPNCYGNAGIDLLKRGDAFEIDFQAMTLKVQKYR